MEITYPERLKFGDEIRVIAPAKSLSIISDENIKLAKLKLGEMGFKVTFSKNCKEIDSFNSSSIKSRVEDLHDAFLDKNVKAILTAIGGFNSNQLLKYIDYELIKKNPKILCGYSDITALANVITCKTGMVTYSGPNFSTFAMKKGLEYTLEYFKNCLMGSKPFKIEHSKEWSNDAWYKNQDDRKFIKNKGYYAINNGSAKGTLMGGNLCTLNLLQGTEFMPFLENSILFIEDDSESKAVNFDRDLQSLIHLLEFKGVRGIVIGRFENESKMTRKLMIQIIKTKKELDGIPVIADIDFGHTTPLITFPIGGRVLIDASDKGAKIIVEKH